MRTRLRAVRPLRSAYHFLLGLGQAWRDGTDASRAELDAAFAPREDPWNYSRAEERQRHAAELALLDAAGGRRFSSALELGCAEGAFTRQLAPRCAALVAVDLSEIALDRARVRCAPLAHVRFERWDLRHWPGTARATYDLVVAIHVLEYVRSPLALRAIARRIVDCLEPGGHLLLGNVCQDAMAETSWWGRLLLQGGSRINDHFERQPALRVVARVETDLGDCRSRDLLLRRVG